MANRRTSGAPDNTGTAEEKAIDLGEPEQLAPIWDENNVLVDPDLHAHFKHERLRVLGEAEVHTEVGGEDVVLTGELLDSVAIPPNTPQTTQRHESQTEDPLSNPKPTGDPNTRPSELNTYTVEQAKVDKELLDAAKANQPIEVGDKSSTANTEGNPTRSDETGNVRGNPEGAEGGTVPPVPDRTIPPREPDAEE